MIVIVNVLSIVIVVIGKIIKEINVEKIYQYLLNFLVKVMFYDLKLRVYLDIDKVLVF